MQGNLIYKFLLISILLTPSLEYSLQKLSKAKYPLDGTDRYHYLKYSR